MNLLNISGEESLDLPDLTFGLNDVPTGLLNELTGGMLQPQGDGSVISGFAPSAQSPTGPVVVGQTGTRNVALLGHQTGLGVTYGVLNVANDDTRALDISTYAPGTYRIYIRFNRVPSDVQTRTFWSGIDQSEYSKSVATRLAGTWEVRIEVAQPAPEWLAIGTAVVTSQGGGQGNAVTVTDQRPLYFEGNPASSYAPAWGSDADRGNRQTATLSDLRTALDALRRCLVDIKGEGLQPWYSRYIGGMNIGTRYGSGVTPTAERLAIGDPNFYLQGSAAVPTIAFDGIDNSLAYSRAGQSLTINLGGDSVGRLNRGGLALGPAIPNLISPVQPLTVWNFAPFGRVAQFAHTGSGQASISIGTTTAGGGRIDFAPSSITDFQTASWSISAVNNSLVDFFIVGPKGKPFESYMNDPTYAWSTTLRGDYIFLTPTNSDGQVRVTKLAPGPSFYPYDEGGTAFMTVKYVKSPRRAFFTGFGLPATLKYTNPNFTLTFSRPLPANAVVTATAGNTTVYRVIAHTIIDTTTIQFQVFDGQANIIDDSFNVLITYGASGAGSAVAG